MNVSSVANTPPSSMQSLFSKPKQDLQSLQSDLGSGDLSGAQKDFADFQADMSGLLGPSPSSSTGLQQASSDFTTLQNDLNAGDLTASQKDFTSILQDLQGASGSPKHHHHHHQEAKSTDAASSGTPGNGMDYRAMMAAYAANSNTGTTGSSLNTSA